MSYNNIFCLKDADAQGVKADDFDESPISAVKEALIKAVEADEPGNFQAFWEGKCSQTAYWLDLYVRFQGTLRYERE